MYLATTALTEFWKVDEPILFLGEWCLKYSERQAWESLTYQVLEYPWNNHERLSGAITYCDGVYESLLETLTEYMNNVHGVNYGKRYWRIILGPWLLYYIHTLYDRYIILCMAFEKFPDLTTTMLARECYLTPTDFFDFHRRSSDDLCNLQLFAQLLEIMGHTFPSKPFSVPADTKKRYDTRRRLKIFLKKMYSMFLRSLKSNPSVLLYDLHFKQIDVWRLCMRTGFKAWPMTSEGKYHTDVEQLHVNKELRRGFNDLPSDTVSDPFQKTIFQTLSVNFPTCYLEGYKKMHESANRFIQGNVKCLVSSFGWTSNEHFKFFAAATSEKGAVLGSVQHGGASGINKYTAGDVHMMDSSDFYYTWGWTDSNFPQAVPMPEPNVQRLRNCDNGVLPFHNDMPALFVGTMFPRYLQYLRYCPLGPQVKNYIFWQVRFLHALPETVRNRFIIRLSPHDYGWANKARLSEEISELRFDDHSLPYLKQVKKCKLVVVDNCQTTFLEAMLLNRPVILFYDPDLWSVSSDALSHLNLLRQAGILYYRPEDAAGKVFEIFENPIAWWNSENVRAAKKQHIEHFAIGSCDWVETWRRELSRLSSNENLLRTS